MKDYKINKKEIAMLEEMRFLLKILKLEMQRIGFWEDIKPEAYKLESKEPFCIDYLTFSQWLQWVYIEKMQGFIKTFGKLPSQSGLLPIAEEAWKGEENKTQKLLLIVECLDLIVSNKHQELLKALKNEN